MVSVSADTPQPTLLVCIHHLSSVAAAVLANGVFCVNVLRDDQSHISDNFAGRAGARGAAKFDCAAWTTQVTGAPRVVDSLVAFDCRVTASERVGSHVVVFGSVQDIFVSGGGAPLIYANRAYGVPRRFHQRRSARGAGAAGAAGAISIGCYQVFAPYIVPALVARLTKLHPGIALTMVEADQEHIIASLRRRDTEIAVLYDFGLAEDLDRISRRVDAVRAVARGSSARGGAGRRSRGPRAGAAGVARYRTQPGLFSLAVSGSRTRTAGRLSHAVAGDAARLRRPRLGLQYSRHQTRQQYVL
jgi:flavin reductase (DIM6/NTAB) family NADH-FMN oxidoreductase RutF